MNDEEPVWEETPPDAAEPTDEAALPAAVAGDEPDGIFSRIRWGLISFIALSMVVIILAAQNTQSVTVKALGWQAEAPLVVIILITVLVSVVLDELVGVIIRRRRRVRQAERRELKRLRDERKA